MTFVQTHAQEKKEEITEIFIVNFKNDLGEATGKHDLIKCNKGQSDMYANEQAKLRYKGQKYTLQSISVKKGQCGVIMKYVKTSGKISMYYKVFDTNSKAQEYIKEKSNPELRWPRELVEKICL